MTCANCGAKLTCGCQKRVGPAGKQCCQHCVAKCVESTGTNRKRKLTKGPFTPHP